MGFGFGFDFGFDFDFAFDVGFSFGFGFGLALVLFTLPLLEPSHLLSPLLACYDHFCVFVHSFQLNFLLWFGHAGPYTLQYWFLH